jgi:hypothetical protein
LIKNQAAPDRKKPMLNHIYVTTERDTWEWSRWDEDSPCKCRGEEKGPGFEETD